MFHEAWGQVGEVGERMGLTNASLLLGAPGAAGVADGAALIGVLQRGVVDGVVAVGGEDGGGHVGLVELAAAELVLGADVDGRLVELVVVPLLNDVDLAGIIPRLTVGPAMIVLVDQRQHTDSNSNDKTYKAGQTPHVGVGTLEN
jgi:hypothetical protein